MSPLHTAPLPSALFSTWTRLGLALGSWIIRLTPVSPLRGQIQEETLERVRPGLHSDQSRALACGGGEPGRQTQCQARCGNPHMAPSQRRVLSPGPLRGPQASFIGHIRA